MVVVIQGDLTAARTDVIVNAANEQPAARGWGGGRFGRGRRA